MSKSRAVWALVAVVAVVSASGVVPLRAQGASPAPPTDLKLVGDHWTPWDPPDPGPDAYIIQKGDTLWDLAEEWLGDPYLWPQVWEENRYIGDSHWIYPGDPLVVPGRPTVVPDGGPPVGQDTGEETGEEVTELAPVPERAPAPLPPPLVPVAKPAEVYCAGYIVPEQPMAELIIAGQEETLKEGLSDGDVVYLNQGRNQGIKPGDEFMVIRPDRRVAHPAARRKDPDLGTMIRRMGKLRVMLVHDQTSTAVVEMACEDIVEGDMMVPWEAIPVPRFRTMPEFDRWSTEPSGGPLGYLVTTTLHQDAIAAGHIIYTDLGVASGVRPGDILTLFQEQDNLPRINLGQAVVLTVEPATSSAKVTYTVRETEVGDRLEIDR